jgi:hypothetical protein
MTHGTLTATQLLWSDQDGAFTPARCHHVYNITEAGKAAAGQHHAMMSVCFYLVASTVVAWRLVSSSAATIIDC